MVSYYNQFYLSLFCFCYKKVDTQGEGIQKVDLVSPMIGAGDLSISETELKDLENSACPTCGSCSGMFTANSMNCLTEALGLSLPGNGSTLATHAARKSLFLEAGKNIVEITKRFYEGDDNNVLPRNIASKQAFENAMSLDVSMGGSTNTALGSTCCHHCISL